MIHQIGTASSILAIALFVLPIPSTAQSFSGDGPAATPPFVLLSGERSVDVSASQSFMAYLLSQDGSVVATLSGKERQEIQIRRDGRYLLDVRASGPWRIRIEEPDSARVQRARGRIEGAEAAAGSRTSAAWLGKGLLGGLLLGPIGTAIAVNRAGKSEAPLPPSMVDRLVREGADYAEGFREAYADQWRGSQRSSALVGGITGTAVLSFAILQLTVLREQPRSEGQPPGHGETAARIPIVSIRFAP